MKYNTISEIEALNEKQAQTLTNEEMLNIKGHQVYFVDLKGYFGYSALVFKDGKQIRHANDYQLHHKEKSIEELKKFYIEKMNNILFINEELEIVKNYDDYRRKIYFLTNYYPLRYDYVSAFNIFKSDEERATFEKKVSSMYYSGLCFSYFYDKKPVEEIKALYIKLKQARDKVDNNFDYLREAFLTELYNHEYSINWQGDYDLFSCFGNVTYSDEKTARHYMDELHFDDTKKSAFYSALKEYSSKCYY